jgi:hypothetical protein
MLNHSCCLLFLFASFSPPLISSLHLSKLLILVDFFSYLKASPSLLLISPYVYFLLFTPATSPSENIFMIIPILKHVGHLLPKIHDPKQECEGFPTLENTQSFIAPKPQPIFQPTYE